MPPFPVPAPRKFLSTPPCRQTHLWNPLPRQHLEPFRVSSQPGDPPARLEQPQLGIPEGPRELAVLTAPGNPSGPSSGISPHSELLRLPPAAVPLSHTIAEGQPPTQSPGYPVVEMAARLPPPHTPPPRSEFRAYPYSSYRNKVLPPLFHPGQPLQPPAQQQIQLGYPTPWGQTFPGQSSGHPGGIGGELPFQASYPSQYVRGVIAYSLSAPAGLEEERTELGDILSSKHWLDLRHMLHREMQNRSVPEFTAQGSDEYADWASSLVNFFQGAEISNTLVQTRLAALTLRHHARYWY